MTTKTDFRSVQHLREVYSPKTRGIVTGEEAAVIKRELELEQRNDIELQNARDIVVYFYADVAEAARNDGDMDDWDEARDAMSAICAVIDEMKWSRGMEV